MKFIILGLMTFSGLCYAGGGPHEHPVNDTVIATCTGAGIKLIYFSRPSETGIYVEHAGYSTTILPNRGADGLHVTSKSYPQTVLRSAASLYAISQDLNGEFVSGSPIVKTLNIVANRDQISANLASDFIPDIKNALLTCIAH